MPEVYRPSPFWQELSAAGIRQLEESGFENFKRTVNTRYFNWRLLGILRHQFFAIARQWAADPRGSVFRATFPQPRITVSGTASFNAPAAWIYKTFVAMYAEVLERQDRRRLLRTLDEPALGNPFVVHHQGRRISQDLCNSIHELYSILGPEGLPPSTLRSPAFCEVGAGYGRVAYVILKAVPAASYCIIDIPPALYLSQRYLTTLFPDLPAFRFRSFTSYDDVAAEFEAARIRFLAPHQAELIPPRSFDYLINISSLHEMTVAQVQNYFRLIHLLCRGRFYTKQWRVSRTQINGCTFREHDYPVPATWRTVYHRRHAIQRMFFEALYEVA